MENPKKISNVPNKLIRYFFIAFIGTLTFILLQSDTFKEFLYKYFTTNPNTILIIQCLILFTILYISNQLVIRQCWIFV
jgi:hypothetical protein